METSASTAERKGTRSADKVVLAVAAILFLLGLICWVMQLVNGMDSYSPQYAWGIYIAGFFTAAAVGAGAMIVAFILSLRGVSSKRLYLAGLGAFVASGFLILADLGAPLAVFNLVFSANFFSPMVMDFWSLVLCAVFCFVGILGSTYKNKTFAAVGLILAVLLLLAEAWLIAAVVVQKLWMITMSAAPLLLQALIGGFSLALLFGTKERKAVSLAFGVTLAVFLASILIDLLAGMSELGIVGVQWRALAVSPIFWVGILIGVAVPLGMLLMKKNGPVMPILALFGIFATKLSYLWSGSAAPGLDVFEAAAPNLDVMELIIAIGFSALGVLVYQVLNKAVVEKEDGRNG